MSDKKYYYYVTYFFGIGNDFITGSIEVILKHQIKTFNDVREVREIIKKTDRMTDISEDLVILSWQELEGE
jgi:hypothetical protein